MKEPRQIVIFKEQFQTERNLGATPLLPRAGGRPLNLGTARPSRDSPSSDCLLPVPGVLGSARSRELCVREGGAFEEVLSKKYFRRRMQSVLLLLVALVGRVAGDSLVIDVAPQEERCFFETLENQVTVTMDVFVGGGATLDIHVRIDGPFSPDPNYGLPVLSDDTVPVIVDEMVTQKDLRTRDNVKAVLDDAYSNTFKSEGGVYRLCVTNNVGGSSMKRLQIDVHVGDDEQQESTYQKRIPLTGAGDGDRPQDMDTISVLLSDMDKLMADLIRKQQRERHRLAVHTSLNRVSRDRLYWSSVVETMIYVLFSVFQILFIRYWFSGRSSKKPSANWA
eukprot:scaffold3283_cov237-Pinguiococcus_pyrenoidosus.AAC.2